MQIVQPPQKLFIREVIDIERMPTFKMDKGYNQEIDINLMLKK